ncbi:flavin reductase family protein [Desulfocurvus sp. DL9XJH121]
MKRSLGSKPLAFPAPVWCVGSYDADGRPNVMTAAWGGICCSKPACLAVSMRSATYSHGCVMARKAFTVSVADTAHAKAADYIGMVSGRDRDKFEATGLTAERAQHVDAPFIAEFPMVIECTLKEVVELGLHTQFVGEIVDVRVEESCLDGNGKPDMAKVAPLLFAPEARAYYGVGQPMGSAFALGKDLL